MCDQMLRQGHTLIHNLPHFRIPNLLAKPVDQRVPAGCAVHERNHPRDRLSLGGAVRRGGDQGRHVRWSPAEPERGLCPHPAARCHRGGLEMVLS